VFFVAKSIRGSTSSRPMTYVTNEPIGGNVDSPRPIGHECRVIRDSGIKARAASLATPIVPVESSEKERLFYDNSQVILHEPTDSEKLSNKRYVHYTCRYKSFVLELLLLAENLIYLRTNENINNII